MRRKTHEQHFLSICSAVIGDRLTCSISSDLICHFLLDLYPKSIQDLQRELISRCALALLGLTKKTESRRFSPEHAGDISSLERSLSQQREAIDLDLSSPKAHSHLKESGKADGFEAVGVAKSAGSSDSDTLLIARPKIQRSIF